MEIVWEPPQKDNFHQRIIFRPTIFSFVTLSTFSIAVSREMVLKKMGLDLLQVSVVVSDFHLQAQVGQVSTFYPTQLMPCGLWQTHWSCGRTSSRPWMPLHLLCDPVPPALHQLRWGCPQMIDPPQGFSWGWAPPWRRIVCW